MKNTLMLIAWVAMLCMPLAAQGGTMEQLYNRLSGRSLDCGDANCCTQTPQPSCPSFSACGLGCNPWYVQTEAVFLSPISSDPSQSFLLTDLLAPATVTPFASTLDSDQFVLTPRLTLGRSFDNGWGIQARYWDLNNSDGDGFAGPFFPVGSAPDLNLVGGSESIDAYTIDIEATRCLCIRGRNLLASFGVRHGALEHSQSQVAFGQSIGNDSYVLSALTQNTFHGTGITYGLSGVRNLRCRKFSLYGGSRLSHLFGTNSTGAFTSAVLASPAGGAASTNGAIASDDSNLFIAELQSGVQWAHCLEGCGARCFARMGFEYQYWNTGNDNIAAANSFAGVTASSNASVAATAASMETHFVGLALAAGFSW